MRLNHKISKNAFILLSIIMVIAIFLGYLSIWYLFLLCFVFLLLTAYGSGIIQAQYFMPVTCGGETKEKNIAITFDDGPHPEITNQVLDILKEYDVKATFFCIGKKVESHPEVVREIDAQGHLVANHTYSHLRKNCWVIQEEKIKKELSQADEAIFKVLNKKPNWFRPPFGVTNPHIAKANKDLGHHVIGWNIRSLDGRLKDEQKIIKRVKKRMKPGGIILFHDIYPRILPILRNILEYARENNYNIVPLNELIKSNPYE